MARPRTPSAIKKATGRPGRVGINKREPRPRNGICNAPAWMTDAQQAIWEYAVTEAPAGVLTSVDWSVFTVFVVAAAAHQEAALMCGERGTVIVTAQGNEIQAPWVGMMNKQAAVLLRACSELGFTPASRSRVSVGGDGDEDEEDPAAQFFQ